MDFLQISIPMSVEFEELMKARDNPSEEAQSKTRFTDYTFIVVGSGS